MSPASLPTAARDELRRLVHGPSDPALLADLHKALASDPPDGSTGRQLLYRLGQLGDTLPYGLFDDPAKLISVHAWAAVADPSLCLAALVHHLLCLGSITELGDPSAPLVPRVEDLRSGRAKGVYLITEAGQANSHLATRTVVELDPATGEFVLHTPDERAAKFGSAGTLDVPQTGVVLARLVTEGTDRGVFAFVVDLTDESGPLPGVEVSAPVGLGALPLDYVQVRFHHVRLPHAHWLSDGARIGEDGTFHDSADGSVELRLRRTLRVGQGLWATMPAVAAATSRQSAVQAVAYALGRPTQGRLAPGAPLLTYRTQQRAVLGALADAFALTCAARGARALWEESRTAPGETSGAEMGLTSGRAMGFTPWTAVSQPLAAYKAVSVRLAARVTAECQRRCGFSGHLDQNRLGAYHGFHHAFDAAGGDSQLIFYDIGRALSGEAGTEAPRVEASPESAQWWPAVMRRHQHALAGQLPAPDAPFDVWNPLLEDAGLLGEVYANALVAEDVDRALDGLENPELARFLTPLAALYGVTAARRWSGSLLALGTLSPAEVRSLPAVADRLCDALLPHLPLLTEVFALPDDVAPVDCDPVRQQWTRGGTA